MREKHDEAMRLCHQADEEQKAQNPNYKETLKKALLLEKEAAYALKDDKTREFEPTRGVFFRSACSIALDAELYNEAKELAQEGLKGDPFPEIKNELEELLKAIQEKIK
ncbi:MAG: hypothetical protein US50_C0063G0006 [Candidatus Nomurabacteria bacterium GW2011_GWB1_37_5]|uniref:Uncharacterized protein n=1 Tax=Candidatus Nomurabacteria bacterium GW2011_GWB1_37_5 TaxID=1618742 RepID=A0A0G0GVN0_9BACT|nr:MAG: hypothetical protein US50_C0063G0006 [Candidatus Nomurabacteria bacterium GW2011_GWB1_37_5]